MRLTWRMLQEKLFRRIQENVDGDVGYMGDGKLHGAGATSDTATSTFRYRGIVEWDAVGTWREGHSAQPLGKRGD